MNNKQIEMLHEGCIFQTFRTDCEASTSWHYYYVKLLFSSYEDLISIMKVLNNQNCVVLYNTSYCIDDDEQLYKLQLMYKVEEESIGEDIMKLLYRSFEENEIIFKADSAILKAGIGQGSCQDYPIYSFSNTKEARSRGVYLGSLWKYIYEGIDHYLSNNPKASDIDATESVLRFVGGRQGEKIATIAQSTYHDEVGNPFANENEEERYKMVDIICNILKSYGYCLIDNKSIVWGDDGRIKEIKVTDSFFFRQDRQSGFMQGVLTSVLFTVFDSTKKYDAHGCFYAEKRTDSLKQFVDDKSDTQMYKDAERLYVLIEEDFETIWSGQ